MNIDDYLRRPEGKTLEFKRDLSSPLPILKTLTAFANGAGGTLVIGVEDKTRDVVGVQDALDQEEKLANWIADGIEPKLAADIEICAWRSIQLLVVHVFPSVLRPHHIRKSGAEAGTYVRIGSTNRQADAPLIASLQRSVLATSFDEEPLPKLSSEALDFRVASELFAERRAMGPKEMESLGALARVQRRRVPTVGGLLLFGKAPVSTFPDAWLQCGRFAGDTKADIVDHTELRQPLPCLVEAGMDFVRKHAMRGMALDGARRVDRWSVPMDAVREALINALVHADYSLTGVPLRLCIFDTRIVVESPGFLLPGLTVEDMLEGVSRLRNRVLGRVFGELGLIEQWGSGIPRIVATCRKHGLAQPEFKEIATGFQVTLSLVQRDAGAEVSQTDRDVLDFIGSRPDGASTAEIAQHLEVTARAARSRMSALRSRGAVVVVGRGERDPKRRYFVAGDEAHAGH
jgi:predicted HTH transcriptional regulator